MEETFCKNKRISYRLRRAAGGGNRQPKFIENAGEDSMYIRLTRMVDDGQMGAVEDCLWERLERGDIEDFQLAFAVYSYMNEKEDDFLREYDFSREEIQDGVAYFLIPKIPVS